MKHGSLIGVVVVVALIGFTPFFARAQGINGWWEARMAIDNGDLVTGVWAGFRAAGPNVSYLYIYDASENSYSGKACHVEREGIGGSYVRENTFSVYIKNNVAVLTGPASVDDDGQLAEGSTMILEISGNRGIPGKMTGYYTKYDVLLEQRVSSGTISALKRNPDNVPPDVTILCP
jgi:hypothetical protein